MKTIDIWKALIGAYITPLFFVCEFIHNVMLDGTLTDDFILLFTLWEEY